MRIIGSPPRPEAITAPPGELNVAGRNSPDLHSSAVNKGGSFVVGRFELTEDLGAERRPRWRKHTFSDPGRSLKTLGVLWQYWTGVPMSRSPS